MLLRTSLSAAGALLLATGASAQTDGSATIHAATTAKNAGTYHVATGTWTRSKSPIAQIGTDVLYDNTCVSGSYIGLSTGESVVDSGRLPSTTSPSSAQSLTGTADSYNINGFNMGYCTGEPTIDVLVNFYQCYVPCADATGLVPDASITMTGMPGVAGGTGSLACWTLTVDLDLTTQNFTLFADCDGTHDAVASLDNFGWSYEQLTASLSGVAAGALVAGDPFGILTGTACPYGDGTTWSGNSIPGTGIGSDDVFETDLAGSFAGCWFFGGYLSGNLYSSFHMRVIGDAAGGPVQTGTQYCFGDGGGTACPCGNNNDGSNGPAGCANGSSAGGATLTGSGAPSIAGDTAVLQADNCQPNQPGLFFRADNAVNGGIGITFGDGLRCAGGNLIRLGVVLTGGFGSATSNPGLLTGLNAGDVRRFQYWYRNPGGSPCGSAFNLTNGFEITAEL